MSTVKTSQETQINSSVITMFFSKLQMYKLFTKIQQQRKNQNHFIHTLQPFFQTIHRVYWLFAATVVHCYAFILRHSRSWYLQLNSGVTSETYRGYVSLSYRYHCQRVYCKSRFPLGWMQSQRLGVPRIRKNIGSFMENGTSKDRQFRMMSATKSWIFCHSQDAAELYESAGLYEKAASVYIQAKSFHQAAPLMARITNPRLHLLFGKAKEKEGQYDEAVKSYGRSGDWHHAVRLLLTKLDRSDEAFQIVRERQTVNSALLAANHCLDNGAFKVQLRQSVASKVFVINFCSPRLHLLLVHHICGYI